jgi:hypothetical protein
LNPPLRTPVLFAALSLLAASSARAAPGEGIRFPGFTLRPTVDGALTWDSNVWLANDTPPAATDEETGGTAAGRREVVSDVFYSVGLNLSAVTRSDSLRASVDAWARMQKYQDTGARDSEEFGERIQVGFGDRRSVAVSIYQRFASVDQYDRGPAGRDLEESGNVATSLTDPTLQERAALNQHTTLDFGADFGRDLTDKLTGDLKYLYMATEYDAEEADFGVDAEAASSSSAASTETLNLNNMTSHRLAAEAGWKATDKSSILLTVEGALQESDGLENPATLLAARIGAASRATSKVQYRAGIGLMHYAYDSYGTNSGPFRVNPETGEQERIPAESETSVEPSFELGAAWAPTERWQVQVSASSGFQPSIQYSGNAIYTTVAMLGVGFRITRSLALSVGAGLRRDEYLDPVRVADTEAESGFREFDKTLDLYSFNARLEYRPPDTFWAANAEVRENSATSNDPASEYESTQVSAGLSMWY